MLQNKEYTQLTLWPLQGWGQTSGAHSGVQTLKANAELREGTESCKQIIEVNWT